MKSRGPRTYQCSTPNRTVVGVDLSELHLTHSTRN